MHLNYFRESIYTYKMAKLIVNKIVLKLSSKFGCIYTKKVKRTLEAVEIKYLSGILSVTRKDNIRNEIMRAELEVEVLGKNCCKESI